MRADISGDRDRLRFSLGTLPSTSSHLRTFCFPLTNSCARERCVVSVRSSFAWESSSIWAVRASGNAGSSDTYVFPAFKIAQNPDDDERPVLNKKRNGLFSVPNKRQDTSSHAIGRFV